MQQIKFIFLNQHFSNRYSSQCQTIMFNWETGLCTPGSFLRSDTLGASLAPTSTEGDLFAPSACDRSNGFQYVTSGSSSACFLVPTSKMKYSDARNHCLKLGAHLFVARSMEKVNLLPHGTYLLGLTDIAQENVFVWEDNGEAISANFRNLLFRLSEPNNSNNEDCVSISTGLSSHVANDISCRHSNIRFVCERPVIPL